MSRRKYNVGDRVLIRKGVSHYGGKEGKIVKVIPPYTEGNAITIYNVKIGGRYDQFYGTDMQKIEQKIEPLLATSTYERPRPVLNKTPEFKIENIEWGDFASKSKQDWDKFAK